MNFKNVGLAFLIWTLTGCATPGVYLEESNYSVKQHRIATTQALGLVREVSRNGRVMLSAFHDAKFKEIDITPKTQQRYFTRVTILGAMRPYRVQVEVILEKRDPDTKQFAMVDSIDELAQKRARAIKDMLNQSRDEATTFDEQNPF